MDGAENLRLDVKNTFLHVTDVGEESVKMSRSRSESSLGSGTALESGSGHSVYTGPGHKLWGESGEKRSSPNDERSSASCRDSVRQPVQPPVVPERVIPAKHRPSWSAGSDLHILGKCSPCAWKYRVAGCNNGEICKFCHMCPPGTVKARALARKENRAKQSQCDGKESSAGCDSQQQAASSAPSMPEGVSVSGYQKTPSHRISL